MSRHWDKTMSFVICHMAFDVCHDKIDLWPWYSVCLSTMKRGDNALGSVRPSVCLFVCPSSPVCRISGAQRSILGAWLCRTQQRAKKSYYQSKMFVCVSTNRADAVDRLLIQCLLLVLIHGASSNTAGIMIMWQNALPFWQLADNLLFCVYLDDTI